MQINGYKRQVMAVGWCMNNGYRLCHDCQSSRDTRELGGGAETSSIPMPDTRVRCPIRGTVHYKRSLAVHSIFGLLGWGNMPDALRRWWARYEGEDYELIYKKVLENT